MFLFLSLLSLFLLHLAFFFLSLFLLFHHISTWRCRWHAYYSLIGHILETLYVSSVGWLSSCFFVRNQLRMSCQVCDAFSVFRGSCAPDLPRPTPLCQLRWFCWAVFNNSAWVKAKQKWTAFHLGGKCGWNSKDATLLHEVIVQLIGYSVVN